jgi:hypothetical protein
MKILEFVSHNWEVGDNGYRIESKTVTPIGMSPLPCNADGSPLSFTDSQIEVLDTLLEEVDFFNWEDTYSDPLILDGDITSLSVDGHKSTMINKYPPGYRRIEAHLNDLLGLEDDEEEAEEE